MSSEATIYSISCPDVSDCLDRAAQALRLNHIASNSTAAFIDTGAITSAGIVVFGLEDGPSCTISAIRELIRHQSPLQAIVYSGCREIDVASAVGLMREGAIDLWCEPPSVEYAETQLEAAMYISKKKRRNIDCVRNARCRLRGLTEFQQDILLCLCHGLSNEDVADRLQCDVDRVQRHRNLIMNTTACGSFRDLVQLHYTSIHEICVRTQTGIGPALFPELPPPNGT